MSQISQQPSSSHRVEVSGWDATQAFFLEKTTLHWDAAGQEISLRTRLREGTVIFIRLLQLSESEENFPVPYVVSRNLPVEIDSRIAVSITRLHPTPAYRQSNQQQSLVRAYCPSGSTGKATKSTVPGSSRSFTYSNVPFGRGTFNVGAV